MQHSYSPEALSSTSKDRKMNSPRRSTIDFIKQFAHAYVNIGTLAAGTLILN